MIILRAVGKLRRIHIGAQVARTILLVEDHVAVREALLVWLGITFPDHRVIAACSGEEAVDMSAATAPDVVIMDISLPGINGIEATRLIKALAHESHIIMLTTHEEEVYKATAAAAGANAFVVKRLMQSQLLPAILKFLPPADNVDMGLL